MHLYRLGVRRRNLQAVPDLPHLESVKLAETIPAEPMVSTIDAGKHVNDADAAFVSNVQVMPMLRPREHGRHSRCQKCEYSAAAFIVIYENGDRERSCGECVPGATSNVGLGDAS